MNPLLRWAKFNVVGAMGMGVQLTALALLSRLAPGHYLVASAVALELTLLHNFTWHVHFTWCDRRGGLAGQLMRFHLSNGVVSMVGNLGLMRVFVHEGHMPVVMANCVAILCCSVANFYVGNRWAFVGTR